MAAGVDEEARELEVARLAGEAVELDERGLDLGVPGRALVAPGPNTSPMWSARRRATSSSRVSPVPRAWATAAWIRWPAQ